MLMDLAPTFLSGLRNSRNTLGYTGKVVRLQALLKT
jgi:hypothetical protein